MNKKIIATVLIAGMTLPKTSSAMVPEFQIPLNMKYGIVTAKVKAIAEFESQNMTSIIEQLENNKNIDTFKLKYNEVKMIDNNLKKSFRDVSKLLKNKRKQYSNLSIEGYKNQPSYSKALKEPLCSELDLTSTGSILTPEQWKKYIKSRRPSTKLTYTTNGIKKQVYTYEKLYELVDSAFSVSKEYYVENGTTINPDFLIALAINESSWGENKQARNKNGFYSVGSVNSNPYHGTHCYDTIEGATYAVIDTLVKNYSKESSKWYDDTKGTTMMGFNTYYCQFGDGDNYANGTPDLSWSVEIADIIKSAMNYNSVKFGCK